MMGIWGYSHDHSMGYHGDLGKFEDFLLELAAILRRIPPNNKHHSTVPENSEVVIIQWAYDRKLWGIFMSILWVIFPLWVRGFRGYLRKDKDID